MIIENPAMSQYDTYLNALHWPLFPHFRADYCMDHDMTIDEFDAQWDDDASDLQDAFEEFCFDDEN